MVKFCAVIFGLLLVCCICAFAMFGLLGHFYVGENCVWKGLLTNESSVTGPCVEAFKSERLESYNKNGISFSYPANYKIEETSSLIYVYEKDPNTALEGDFIQNVVITSDDISTSSIADSTCNEYGYDYVLPGLQSSYRTSISSVKESTINGKRACNVVLNVVNSLGKNVVQHHYGIFAGDTLYYVTITVEKETTDITKFNNIVNSFKIQ